MASTIDLAFTYYWYRLEKHVAGFFSLKESRLFPEDC
jgi:hypothetical protein